MVQKVEGIHTKLPGQTFRDFGVLDQSEIPVGNGRSDDNVAAQITEGVARIEQIVAGVRDPCQLRRVAANCRGESGRDGTYDIWPLDRLAQERWIGGTEVHGVSGLQLHDG